MTSGRNVDRTCALISSTAFSPAAMSTPAAAYVSRSSSDGFTAVRASRVLDRVDGQLRVGPGLERELGVVVGHGHGVLAREARGAERLGSRTGRGDEPVEVEVCERVDTEVV